MSGESRRALAAQPTTDTGCVLAEHDGSQMCPDGCWNGHTCVAVDPTRHGSAQPTTEGEDQ